jgi:hypothetical protein
MAYRRGRFLVYWHGEVAGVSRHLEGVQEVLIGRLGSPCPGTCLTRPTRVHLMFDSGCVRLVDQPGWICRNSWSRY